MRDEPHHKPRGKTENSRIAGSLSKAPNWPSCWVTWVYKLWFRSELSRTLGFLRNDVEKENCDKLTREWRNFQGRDKLLKWRILFCFSCRLPDKAYLSHPFTHASLSPWGAGSVLDNTVNIKCRVWSSSVFRVEAELAQERLPYLGHWNNKKKYICIYEVNHRKQWGKYTIPS